MTNAILLNFFCIIKKRIQILFFILNLPLLSWSQETNTMPLKGFLVVHYAQEFYPYDNRYDKHPKQGHAYFMDTINFLHFARNVNTKQSRGFYYIHGVLDTANLEYTFLARKSINIPSDTTTDCSNKPIEYFNIYACEIEEYNIEKNNYTMGGYGISHIYERKILRNNYTYIYHMIYTHKYSINFLFRLYPTNPERYSRF